MSADSSTGPFISAIRKELGITVVELAKNAGWASSQQTRLEKGDSGQGLEINLVLRKLIGNPRMVDLFNGSTDELANISWPMIRLPYELGVAVPELAVQVGKFNQLPMLKRYYQLGRRSDRCNIMMTLWQLIGKYEKIVQTYREAGFEEYTAFADGGDAIKAKASDSPVPKLEMLNEAFVRLRNTRGLSTRQLAGTIGANHSLISQYESRQTRLSINVLNQACRSMKLTLDDFLTVAHPELTLKHPLFLPYGDYTNLQMINLVAQANRVFASLTLQQRVELMLDFNDWLSLEVERMRADKEVEGEKLEEVPTPKAFDLLDSWLLSAK